MEMVNCDFENFGCQGGYLINTIDYLQIEGLVSDQCVPYASRPSRCDYRCSGIGTPERYYCKKHSMKALTTNEEIMSELELNGPMMMGLMIYEDFLNYESGIYKHVAGEQVGGHAMKLIGYGFDDQEGLFWLLQN